jgi:hypothetical protein
LITRTGYFLHGLRGNLPSPGSRLVGNELRKLGEYDMRLIILLVGCLVIAAELKAVKLIEEMNQRAELRAEEIDYEGGKLSEEMKRELAQR